ncbi:hypothetical protein BDN67DRAFT_985057 [Paxillus ammoniavirescens]|nr:hypothetical protein BDN67DRAFT_985057 [Paxillus ammoniavirescens]
MPRDTCKVRFASEADRKAMVYHLPAVNEGTPVPSPPKCPQKICRACSNQQSSGEGTSMDPHTTEPHFLPISQLVVPAQPKPRKNKDFEATGHCTRPGELVIPAAPKTAGNQAVRFPTNSQTMNAGDIKQCPQIRPPPQSPDVFNEPEDITMDYMDVDPSPSQINPSARLEQKAFSGCSGALKSKWASNVLTYFGKSDLHANPVLYFDYGGPDAHDIGQEWPHLQTDLCVDLVTENRFADTLAARISYQATPDLHKIDYKEGLDDPLKRAMEDYQQMFLAACKCRGCVLERQKRSFDDQARTILSASKGVDISRETSPTRRYGFTITNKVIKVSDFVLLKVPICIKELQNLYLNEAVGLAPTILGNVFTFVSIIGYIAQCSNLRVVTLELLRGGSGSWLRKRIAKSDFHPSWWAPDVFFLSGDE